MKEGHILQDHIENLVKGIFEYETAKLHLSEKKLELSIEAGHPVAGSFEITSVREQRVKGRIFTSTPRMRCEVSEFDDFKVEVPYSFDCTGMEEGDVLKGEISIVSGAGEYTLPFVVSVLHGTVKSSVGNIKNLFHFTNLAQSDFNEAVKIFYSADFKRIFSSSDGSYYKIYRGLSVTKGLASNVEEFLVSIHKKSPVGFCAQEELVIDDVEKEDVYEIDLTRSGWGYVAVRVTAEGAFLRTEKTFLTDDDFLGNHCALRCMIDREKLHAGNNYGAVLLRSAHRELRIAITVKNKAAGSAARQKHLSWQKHLLILTQTYISFRLKEIGTTAWIKDSMRIVEKMLAAEEKSVSARLFQAQLLLTQNRLNEAKWILDHIESGFSLGEERPELYGYYLYLRALEAGDGTVTEEMSKKVHSLYNARRNSGRLLWVLMYLDEKLAAAPQKKLSMLEHQFETGSISPVLYLEAYRLYAENPLFLVKLEAYELQVLYWAVRHGLFQEDLMRQTAYLAGKVKHFEPILHKILTSYYMKTPLDEVLSAICMHLMRGNRTEEEDFPWYERAVIRELRLTRLYEYYLYSVPFSRREVLPKTIQMYFAYNCNADYKKTAWLYENLIRNGDRDPDILRSYEVQMEQFAIQQIELLHLDENLVCVYEYMLSKEAVRKVFREKLAYFVFKHRLKGEVPITRYKYLVIVQEQLRSETRIPLSSKDVYVDLYGSNYEVFLEDDEGRRFHDGICCELVPCFCVQDYDGMMVQMQNPPIGVSIYMSEGKRHYISIHEKNVRFVREVAESDEVREDYKREIRQNLLQYYYDHDCIQELDTFLGGIGMEDLYARERAEIIELMVRLGRHRESYEAVCRYGTENIHSKVLVKLASRMITEHAQERDSQLVAVSHMAFRAGKYDMTVLNYLTDYYEGTTKALRNIWRAAVNFEVDTHELEERIIVQMLYTHTFVGERQEIFESYKRGGAKTPVTLAYLSYHAYEYFSRDSVAEERFFEMLLREYERGEELNDMCRLALVRYFAECMEQGSPSRLYTENVRKMTADFIRRFLEHGIVFSFFLVFEQEVEALSLYEDRVFVEYRAVPGSRVVIHYVLETDNGGSADYKKEEMHHLFGGFFSKTFILFFGDTLQYYITEEIHGKEHLTQSKVISRSDISMGSRETRYDVLNDMMAGRTLQDDASLLDMMEVYRRREKAVSEIFDLK